MNYSRPSCTLPPAALREFKKATKADWHDGVPLVELLDRVNRVAELLVDDAAHPESGSGRVRHTFTERSFRHYQTLGSIDVPEKRGRSASYGFRHFLQALLVRKLLWEKLSAEQITTMLSGRDAGELERMLLGGVEIVARTGGADDEGEKSDFSEGLTEMWNRVRVVPGLELHVSSKLPPFTREDHRRLIARLKEILRRQGS